MQSKLQRRLKKARHSTTPNNGISQEASSTMQQQFHLFTGWIFLNYHPINLKINRINCYHSFAISKSNPLMLYSWNTSCFCEACKLGNFQACVDMLFHGTWHTNVLDITPVICTWQSPWVSKLMSLLELIMRASFPKPYLVILYKHKSKVRPIHALIQPAANFNLATVWAHLLE